MTSRTLFMTALKLSAAAGALSLALAAAVAAQPGTAGGAVIHEAPAKGAPDFNG